MVCNFKREAVLTRGHWFTFSIVSLRNNEKVNLCPHDVHTIINETSK